MLTDSKCREPNRSGKPEKRFDGGGLYLLVTPTNRKSWYYTYRFGGKQKALMLLEFNANACNRGDWNDGYTG
jgi:hypothetical protein